MQTNKDYIENALWHYKFVVEKDKSHYKANCQIGIIYLERNNYEDSGEYLRASLSIEPNYIPAVLAMGKLLNESENYEAAIKYFKKALTLNSQEN